MNGFSSGTKTALLATTFIIPASMATKAIAQDQDFALEEIIVTAQKRTENLQDAAVSVQVLGNQRMEDLNIQGFGDYVLFLPGVSYIANRPGVAQVYMRGIVSGSNGNHSASRPSVGVYMDEQPITTINQILDLHIYDIARVETLSGPQGTLFGASSQAGTMRIITNKPVIGEFEAGYDVALNTIKSGEMGYTIEGFANIPISDNSAVRLVGWHDSVGGYIDNVLNTLDYAAAGMAGESAVDNAALVEEDFNDTTTTGARAQLRVDLNENWTVTPGLTYQEQKSTGVFHHDPEDLGDLQTSQFFPTEYDENWYQASLTVRGQIGDLEVVYAGAYLDRNVDSMYDYSGYSLYLSEYYGPGGYYPRDCVYFEDGFDVGYYADPMGACADPSQLVTGDESFKRNSHELRVQSSQDSRLRWIAGLYYQNQEHNFDLQWVVPEMNPIDSVIQGGHTTWQTYQVREDRDRAAFGEMAFDITDQLTATAGIRFFKYNNTLYGFNGFIGHCTGSYINGEFVEDRSLTPQYPCFDTRILDGVSKGNGTSFKINLSYDIDDNKMVYATYSEGFRAGGVNRARVPGIPNYEPDWVFNYELGWKTTWLDNRLRFNGSVYLIDWKDFQFSFLDFTISNLTIIGNVGQARTKGAEFDLDFAASENLTLSLSASYNDAKLRADYFRNSDEELAGFSRAQSGDPLPFTPEFQFSAFARYAFDVGDFPAHVQAAWVHTGSSWSDMEEANRQRQASYDILNLSFGINADNWSLNFFADNVTDERAELNRFDPGYPSTVDTFIETNRPRTLGVRFGQRF